MLPRLEFEPLQSLFSEEGPVPKDLMRDAVLRDFKQKEFIGVPDASLQISFSPESGDDILVRRIDPENALGYSVFSSEKDYFDHLSSSLYEPTQDEIQGALGD